MSIELYIVYNQYSHIQFNAAAALQINMKFLIFLNILTFAVSVFEHEIFIIFNTIFNKICAEIEYANDWPYSGYPQKKDTSSLNGGHYKLPTANNEARKMKNNFFYFDLFDGPGKKISSKIKSIVRHENNFYVPMAMDLFSDIFKRTYNRRQKWK